MLSLFNIVEQFAAPGFPAGARDFTIVTLWQRNEDEIDATMVQNVVLSDPEGNNLGGVETRFVFEKPRQRVINRVERLAFPKPGIYEFRLFVRREGAEFSQTPKASYPIHMIQAPGESQ